MLEQGGPAPFPGKPDWFPPASTVLKEPFL